MNQILPFAFTASFILVSFILGSQVYCGPSLGVLNIIYVNNYRGLSKHLISYIN